MLLGTMPLEIRPFFFCLCSSAQRGLRFCQFFVSVARRNVACDLAFFFLCRSVQSGLSFKNGQLLANIHVDESVSSDTGKGQYWAIFMLTKVLRATREMGNIGQYSC